MANRIPLNDISRWNQRFLPEIERAIGQVIAKGIYLRGNEIKSFEEEWAHYCGQKYCVAVKNGTDALTLSARAMGLERCLVQANTLPLTAQGLMMGGAEITIVDIDGDGRSQIHSPHLVPVLLYGRLPSAAELESTLFDAAHAHGWQPPQHATATWSFYPSKTLGAFGDSGAITTNDPDVYRELTRLNGGDDKLKHPYQINSRMDEIQAAILRVKLRHLDDFLRDRKRIAEFYIENLNAHVHPVNTSGQDLNHLFVVKVDGRRDELQQFLHASGIDTKIHFPIPLNELKAKWETSEVLLNARSWCESIITLPLFPGMTDSEMLHVVEQVNLFYSRQ